jgi:hypothetical protein
MRDQRLRSQDRRRWPLAFRDDWKLSIFRNPPVFRSLLCHIARGIAANAEW